MFTLSWLEALPLCWRGWDVIGGFEIVIDVAWTLILCILGVTQKWMSSVFEMFILSWLVALPLCWHGWDVIGGFEIVIHDVWFAEDDNTGFLSVGLDDLGQLYLKERPMSLTTVPISTINTKYGK